VQRRLELVDTRDVQVGELWPQASGVDDAISELAFLDLHAWDQRIAHELRIRMRPRNTGENSDVTALVEAEAAGAACDLRDLPRQEIAALVPVELVGLRKEQRLARQIHAVTQHVGRSTHLGSSGDEPVDLLPP